MAAACFVCGETSAGVINNSPPMTGGQPAFGFNPVTADRPASRGA